MKRTFTLVLIATTLMVSACGGGSSRNSGPPAVPSPSPAPTPTPQPPPAAQTNFTAFMRTQFEPSVTTDANEPAEVESVEWVFTDDDDETEYDDVLATSM